MLNQMKVKNLSLKFSHDFQEPVLFTKFLPTVAGTIVDDQTRPILLRLPDESTPLPRPPSQLFMIFIKESAVSSMIALYYTLQVGPQKNI